MPGELEYIQQEADMRTRHGRKFIRPDRTVPFSQVLEVGKSFRAIHSLTVW